MSAHSRLPDLSFYAFGTGDVGQPAFDAKNDGDLVRIALEAGAWLHGSPDYGGSGNAGGSFRFLRQAFDETNLATDLRSRMILKLFISGYESGAPGTTDDVRANLEAMRGSLGFERLDIAQIWGGEDLFVDFREHGPRWQALGELKEAGLVGSYVFQLTPSIAAKDVELLAASPVDGYIFYHNVIEREVNNEVHELLVRKKADVIALRTLGRVYVDYTQWDSRTAKVHRYAHGDTAARVDALKGIFERSGCRDWLHFNMCFLKSVPNVRSTVGMTTNPRHLEANLEAARSCLPLDAALAEEIHSLHQKWYRPGASPGT